VKNESREIGTKALNRKSFEAICREWHQQSRSLVIGYRDEIIDTFEQDIFPTLVSAL
jgi:hypothetical protein